MYKEYKMKVAMDQLVHLEMSTRLTLHSTIFISIKDLQHLTKIQYNSFVKELTTKTKLNLKDIYPCYIFLLWFFLHFPSLVTIVSCMYTSLVNATRYSDFLTNLSVLHGIRAR